MALAVTQQRVAVWTDDRALWTSAVQQAPRKPRPWLALGVAFSQQNRPAEALACFEHAWVVAATRPLAERVIGEGMAAANLALLAQRVGLPQEARTWMWAARSRLPSDPQLATRAAWVCDPLGCPSSPSLP